jgi:hypothetical protein
MDTTELCATPRVCLNQYEVGRQTIYILIGRRAEHERFRSTFAPGMLAADVDMTNLAFADNPHKTPLNELNVANLLAGQVLPSDNAASVDLVRIERHGRIPQERVDVADETTFYVVAYISTPEATIAAN